MSRKVTTEDFVKRAIEVHGNEYIYDSVKYVKISERVIITCNKHGNFEQTPANHLKGHKCKKCYLETNYENSFIIKAPELTKYFKYKQDGYNLTTGTKKKTEMVCPNCKNEQIKSAHSLYNKGFSCPLCSDGVSMPNKFIANLLDNLEIDFENEKIFNWSNKKRYDFFIPKLNMIIEAHGQQHYEENTLTRKSLEEEQKNDILKEEIAKENGIEEYIIIDCRRVDLAWMIDTVEKSLRYIFNLKNIDYYNIYEKCQKSRVCEAWRLWDNGLHSYSLIAEQLKCSPNTAREYLYRGEKLGKCSFKRKSKKI